VRRLSGNKPLKQHGEVPHDVEAFVQPEQGAGHDFGDHAGPGGNARPHPAAPRHELE
jgi:multidrug efflux pump